VARRRARRLLTGGGRALHASGSLAAPPVYRIDHVSDGDTVVLRTASAYASSRSTRPRPSSAASATGERLRCGRRRCFCAAHAYACSPSLRPWDIFVVNVDGSGVKRLKQPPRTRRRTDDDWSQDPSWSPDGKRIAFDGARKESRGVPDIYVMRADGSGVRRIAGGSAYQWYPVWSPDGRKIMFEAFVGNPLKETR
jgi:Tol biopolymer transport system component